MLKERRHVRLPNESGVRSGSSRTPPQILLSDAEPIDHVMVAINIAPLQVIKHAAPLADEFQQAAPRVIILDVSLEMLGQFIDSFCQQSDLHFR